MHQNHSGIARWREAEIAGVQCVASATLWRASCLGKKESYRNDLRCWIPACAGMTGRYFLLGPSPTTAAIRIVSFSFRSSGVFQVM